MDISKFDDPCCREEIRFILDLLNKGDEDIKRNGNKDVVLLIGTTGGGKTTLAHLLAGNSDRLESKEVGDDRYLIVDPEDTISNDSTITSKTIFPSFMLDGRTDTAFYDCPGFSDTRSAAYDIAATYFVKSTVDIARSVKLVFVIQEFAVLQGSDRKGFPEVVSHATKFVGNLKKYRDSIALVVTQVNGYNKKGKISHKSLVKNITDFLKETLKEIQSRAEDDDSKQKIDFIETLLQKSGEEFTKVGIFRSPQEAGKLNGIEEIQEDEHKLRDMLQNKVNFTVTNNGDFGYTVSAESRNFVSALVKNINQDVSEKLICLGKEIEGYYSSQNHSNIELWRDKYKSLYDSFVEIQGKALTNKHDISQLFLDQIIEKINLFNIGISSEYLEGITNSFRQLEFLSLVSKEERRSDTMCLAEGLAYTTNFFNNYHKWYAFLCRLYNILSSYNVQQNTAIFNIVNLLKQVSTDNGNINLSRITFEPAFSQLLLDRELEYDDVKDITLNTTNLKTFEEILNLTLNDNVKLLSPADDKMIMIGRFVKMSDVKRILEHKKLRFLEVFALNKVFIDTDLDKTGEELHVTIIAPIWEVIGEPHIILDGKSGDPRIPHKAEDGLGECGSCGLPGGAAGIFLGIGKHFFNDEHLRISANGGKGGKGQDGGQGENGRAGANPEVPDWEDDENQKSKWRASGFTVDTTSRDYYRPLRVLKGEVVKVTGERGCVGGNGGDGGCGGVGGPAGRVIILNIVSESKAKVACCSGSRGEPGSGGSGGLGGINGHQVQVYIRRDILKKNCKFEREGQSKEMGRADSGNTGGIGTSEKDMINPGEAQVLKSPRESVMAYRELLNNELKNNVNEQLLKEFYSDLITSERITSYF